MKKPSTPAAPPPPAPAVNNTAADIAQAGDDERRKQKGRYSFDNTILSKGGATSLTPPTMGKTTLG